MTDRPLEGRLILLGVTGSIAAYKAAELLRLLTAAGAEVQVMMTRRGHALHRPAHAGDALRAAGHARPAGAAGRPAHQPHRGRRRRRRRARGARPRPAGWAPWPTASPTTSSPPPAWPRAHRSSWRRPWTATCTRIRPPRATWSGCASSATRSSTRPPVRWPPGRSGVGRLAALPLLVEAVAGVVAGRPVRQPDPAARRAPRATAVGGPAGWHIVVSAGGTAEPIDPVRFIGNRSSGRMGFAIAEAALQRGARVTLIKGITSVAPPAGADIVDAETAARHARGRPGRAARLRRPRHGRRRGRLPARGAWRTSKLARAEGLTLELEPTADILAEAAAAARAAAGGTTGGRRPAAHRRLRGRDRLAGAGPGEGRPQGRRPARRQRRLRAGLRLRHGDEPRDHHRARPAPGALAAGHQGGRWPTTCSTACCACARRAVHHWADERQQARPPHHHRRHRPPARGGRALRHHHRLRLPDGPHRRRGRHPAHPGGRFAGHGHARLRHDRARQHRGDAPPHAGRGPRRPPRPRRGRHALPQLRRLGGGVGRARRPLPLARPTRRPSRWRAASARRAPSRPSSRPASRSWATSA